MGTVELGHVLGVFLQNVHLHRATLCKACVTDVALVRLLAFGMKGRRWLIWVMSCIPWPLTSLNNILVHYLNVSSCVS